MHDMMETLFGQVEVFGLAIPLLGLIAGGLIVVGVARQAWPPVGFLALVAIFSYWIPFLKN